MVKVVESSAYGIYVIDFHVTLENKDIIPYQLTFERDLFFDRTNVTLVNLLTGDDNKQFCSDIKTIVCDSFENFFSNNPDEAVYFEIDLDHKRNFIKLCKFLRWAASRFGYKIDVLLTIKDEIKYAEVTIKAL